MNVLLWILLSFWLSSSRKRLLSGGFCSQNDDSLEDSACFLLSKSGKRRIFREFYLIFWLSGSRNQKCLEDSAHFALKGTKCVEDSPFRDPKTMRVSRILLIVGFQIAENDERLHDPSPQGPESL